MSKIQINRQGFYPIINKEQEIPSVYRVTNNIFNVDLPTNAKMDIYIDNNPLYSTAKSLVDLSGMPVPELINRRLNLKIIRKVLGCELKPITLSIPLEVCVCSEDDEFLITCSDKIYCS